VWGWACSFLSAQQAGRSLYQGNLHGRSPVRSTINFDWVTHQHAIQCSFFNFLSSMTLSLTKKKYIYINKYYTSTYLHNITYNYILLKLCTFFMEHRNLHVCNCSGPKHSVSSRFLFFFVPTKYPFMYQVILLAAIGI
jgi:hypothetical protein